MPHSGIVRDKNENFNENVLFVSLIEIIVGLKQNQNQFYTRQN